MLAAVGLLAFAASGGGAYYYFSHRSAPDEEVALSKGVSSADFVDVPPVTVNLRSGGGEPHFLKLRFIVVASDEAKAAELKDKLPVLLDALQPFLRELRPSDLDGSAAVFRIKEEMLRRATRAFGRGAVTDILIQDLVQQ
ncbi:flagellar basal body-associated FliL family protein [Novosphingobium profundi]|nr:flagellar basal body-associated FliL family protein [Novosphingobium profundi]